MSALIPTTPNQILRLWLLFGVAVGIGLIGYGISPAFGAPGALTSLVFGFTAFALYIASGFYLARKRLYFSAMGKLHSWMIAHMVLGGLLLLSVSFHVSAWPLSPWGWIMLGLLFLQMGSGVWGMYELRATPKRFAVLATEDIRFPSVIASRLRTLHEGLNDRLENREPEFKKWFAEHYGDALKAGELPACEGYPEENKRQANNLHKIASKIVLLRVAQRKVDTIDKASIRWLYLHVPSSVAMTVFLIIHVGSWFYYG